MFKLADLLSYFSHVFLHPIVFGLIFPADLVNYLGVRKNGNDFYTDLKCYFEYGVEGLVFYFIIGCIKTKMDGIGELYAFWGYL